MMEYDSYRGQQVRLNLVRQCISGSTAQRGSGQGQHPLGQMHYLSRTCCPRYESYSISTFLNSNGSDACCSSSPGADRSRTARLSTPGVHDSMIDCSRGFRNPTHVTM